MRTSARFPGTPPTDEEIAAILTALSRAVQPHAEAFASEAPWKLAMRNPDLTDDEVRALARSAFRQARPFDKLGPSTSSG